jgi:serine phosphatase RsbU (regulator of sigma subunit)
LIFYKPKDIVSGDFYFIEQYNNRLYVAAVDCTGHGVPGAFMSMLGYAFIGELIRNPLVQNAAQLLEELRSQIKLSLQQEGKIGEAQDGMDIAFVIIDPEKNRLDYAGANNSLYLFRQQKLEIYKADSMPIGIFLKEKSFTNYSIDLQKDDVLYLFSDGYLSQFDRHDKEIFKTRRFKELLTRIHLEPFEEQYRILETELREWQGQNVQTDDILVMGLRFSTQLTT